MNAVRTAASVPAAPAGITLLEVLVSCGILVVGLASIAAILPAAGSRLGQATVEDRAGTAAANAYAECVARGLVSSDIFLSATSACAFGRGLENIVPAVPSTKGRRGKNKTPVSPLINTATSTLLDRIDEVRGFVLEDDLSYLPPGVYDTPVNGFVQTGMTATGNRSTRDGVCWGAMLAATSGTAVPGAEATLSIAVFRKDSDEAAQLGLTPVGGPLFTVTSAVMGTGTAMDASSCADARKQFMPGCGYVIALPLPGAPPGTMPKWVKVTSSWTNPPTNPLDPLTIQPLVALDLEMLGNAVEQAKYVATGSGPSGSMTVIGFPNLVRVDQYTVTLD